MQVGSPPDDLRYGDAAREVAKISHELAPSGPQRRTAFEPIVLTGVTVDMEDVELGASYPSTASRRIPKRSATPAGTGL